MHDIADLQEVMCRLVDQIDDVVAELPDSQHRVVPNALLNLAVDCAMAAEGPEATAAILRRLADLITSGARPEGREAFRLNGHDA